MSTHDDRIFNYLISRLQSRENTALSIAGFASSASLVFLGLTFESTNTRLEWFVIGVLFPALAFAFNEFSLRGIHTDDYEAINKLIEKTDPQRWKQETEKVIKNEKHRKPRLFLSRFSLLSPILGWLLAIPIKQNWNANDTLLIDVIFTGIIIGISAWIALNLKMK